MVSSVSLITRITNVKQTHINDIKCEEEVISKDGQEIRQTIIKAHVWPYKSIQKQCPVCRKKCPGYDNKYENESRWRGPNLAGASLYFCYRPTRIKCPEHGVKTEYIPWADGDSRFLASFNNEVAFLALNASKVVVAEYMKINWRTVGNCIKATADRLEPDRTVRLRGLKRICVDETSYKKGRNYITVVVNMDTGAVVWLHEGYGYEVFKLFCEELTEEEQKAIEIVAGDGAKWIDACCEQYLTNAQRCVDPFHVVSWINDTLDLVRNDLARKAQKQFDQESKRLHEEADKRFQEWKEKYERYKEAKKELEALPKRKGNRPKRIKELREFARQFEEDYGEQIEVLSKAKKGELTEEEIEELADLETAAKGRKGTKYVLGMNPEHLNVDRTEKLELIRTSDPELYEAYRLKETLRVIIHMSDVSLARESLEAWIEEAKKCKFKAFCTLADKIERNKESILRSIEYHESSSRSEQTNGLVKTLIRIAHGFRNMDNMLALIYLKCSTFVIPLDNRVQSSHEEKERKRARQRDCRKKREADKKAKFESQKAAE